MKRSGDPAFFLSQKVFVLVKHSQLLLSKLEQLQGERVLECFHPQNGVSIQGSYHPPKLYALPLPVGLMPEKADGFGSAA